MARPSRLTLAKPEILSLFSEASQKVYSRAQLATVLIQNRHSWHLAAHTTSDEFIAFLTKQGDLRAHKFRSKTYNQEITRYSWGKASPFELAISIKSRAYLCHATALMLHGLAKLTQKTIYVNAEQSQKQSPGAALTQEGIDRAFSGKQRQSNLIYSYDRLSVIMISGKHSNRLGVEEMAGPTAEIIQVTNLERTLIDIVVRPTYAGGAVQVLKAYKAAKDRVSVPRLLAVLKKLNYLYPYHQPIGFLMQQAGYPDKDLAPLHALGISHDFYLAHGMKQPEYSQYWRLFYPPNLKSYFLS